MKNDIIILEIKFAFSEWENKTVSTFRNNIEQSIGLTNARTSLLLSTELDKDGITFFLLTTNREFANEIKLKFKMDLVSSNIDFSSLAVEYGNLEMIKTIKFRLGSQSSIDYATSLIQTFAQQEGFHSDEIYDNPDDLIRSFHFLKDCYYFCEGTPYYKNKEWYDKLETLDLHRIINVAISVPATDIPTNPTEKLKFGREYLKQNPKNEQDEIKLIYWRSKKQWQHWLSLSEDDMETYSNYVRVLG